MGREATCTCDWAGTKSRVKALVEPPDLILRGELRQRIPIAQMKQLRVAGAQLHFRFDGAAVALDLGEAIAAKWAKTLLTPPPNLARKLGITGESAVWTIGKADDPSLLEALAEAQKVSTRGGDLIVACVHTPDDLRAALLRTADALQRRVPIWFVYRKGPGQALNESIVRATALQTGIVDTKVAAVSATLTALRFVKRKV